ncbi:MAG: S8 family serine peptidase [Bacteroidota bacterium]
MLIFFGTQTEGLAQYVLPNDQSLYDPETIILKLKKANPSASGRSLSPDQLAQNLTSDLEGSSCVKMFEDPPSGLGLRVSNNSEIGIDRIYKVKIGKGEDLQSAINELSLIDEVEYAEPYFLPKMLDVPNDPFADPNLGTFQQDYLQIIQAYQAWDITQGDESVVIAILDSGTDPNHEDISGNFSINEDEIPDNGIDDDGDGFIDNIIGYDLADDDNNVFAAGDSHGTQVTGISSASTDNGVGIAGVGYNSKLMIIKVFTSDGDFFNMGYEGIKIAADLGADVINLSWGVAGQFFQFGQDMINYAVLEQDAVVVAAAGNTNAELTFYPAAFDNVLSVAASTPADLKTSFSTYSTTVDLIAPGLSEFTTDNSNNYRNAQGTSFASPMVAGVAALVKAVRPDLNAVQIMEQVRVSADDIYSLGNNQLFFERLGFGRLNAFRAVSDNTLKSVRFDSLDIQGSFGDLFFNGDTLDVTLHLTNHLSSTENLVVDISSESEFVQVLDEALSIGSLGTLNSFSNSEPIRLYLDSSTPPEEDILIRVGYQDNNYSDYQYFSIKTAPGTLEIINPRIETSVNSVSQLGVGGGSNFLFDGDDVLESSGFILAKSSDTVSSSAINNFQFSSFDQSFEVINSLSIDQNDFDETAFVSVFDDSNDAIPLGVSVSQKARFFNQDAFQNILIFEYGIQNNSDEHLDSVFAGFFSDWVLSNNADQAFWNPEREYGYVSSTENNRIMGLAAFSLQEKSYFAIDKLDLNGNVADLTSSFLDENKFEFLSNGISKTNAGLNEGNDVAHLVGTQLPNLAPGEETKVAFAIFGANSLEELNEAFDNASTLLIPEADFSITPDTLFLGDDPSNKIEFRDESSSAIEWDWDFGNGFTSQLQNPIISFTEPGIYNVKLIITSVIGFVDSVSKPIAVVVRPEQPIFLETEFEACINTSLGIEATNTSSIRVYPNSALINPIFQGALFNTGILRSDIDYFIVNVEDQIESLPVKIIVDVEDPGLEFIAFPDTSDLSSSTLVRINNLSPNIDQTTLLVEGENFGSISDLTYEYQGLSEINIELSGETSNGCRDTLRQTITIETSNTPGIEQINACPDDLITIRPSNGTFFNFYSDADGEALLGKGSALEVIATAELTVFVSGNDLFGESDLVEVPISVDDLVAGLEFSTNPLSLNSSNSVVLQNTSEAADSSFWFFNGVLLRNSSDTTLAFNTPGTFSYGVMAFRGESCVDTAFQTLVVDLITSANEIIESRLSIYPNPVQDFLTVKGVDQPSYGIFDLAGKEFPVITNSENQIDVSALNGGLYILEVVEQGQTARLRFIKEL